jgi:hypothetical protein
MRVALMITCPNNAMLPDRQVIVVRADHLVADVPQAVVEHDRL